MHAFAAGEGAGFWRSVMAGLNNRGARDSLLTCCDGLAGFGDAITSAFPQILQRCAVHDAGLPVMPASRRVLVAAGLEPREGRRNRVAWSALASSVLRQRKVVIAGEGSVAGFG